MREAGGGGGGRAGGLQTSFLFFLAKSKTEAAEFPRRPPLTPMSRIGGGGRGMGGREAAQGSTRDPAALCPLPRAPKTRQCPAACPPPRLTQIPAVSREKSA